MDELRDNFGLTAFTMSLLRCGDRYLMLRRAEHKAFAPGRWTGIGGKVEPNEFQDLRTAALREIEEETGVTPGQIENFALRRSLLQQRPGYPVTILLYFTGDLQTPLTSEADEGTLHWLTDLEIAQNDVIENTRLIIPLLIDALRYDPTGQHPLITGAASFDEDGELRSIVWSE